MRRKVLALFSIVALAATLAGSDASAATGREPVIVIPGVAGSEFVAANAFRLSVDNGHGGTYTRDYSAGEKVWVNTSQAIALGHDDYFDALKIKPDGVTPVAPTLQARDIYHASYDDLIGYLQRQGYVSGVDLWVFPYDWRRDLRVTSSQLDALITKALVAANGGRTDAASWTIRRADIVAHSMGGLVGRHYISDPGRASRVDQLITLGTPQLGATKFLKALLYGDQFGPSFLGIGLNPQEVKDVVQNMPGGMQLLPSRAYFTYYNNADAARLRPYVEDRDVDGNGRAWGVLDYDTANKSMKQFLLNMGKNRTVINMAEATHDAMDRQRHGGVNGVRWAALIGTGYGTLGQLREYTGSCLTWTGYKPCAKRDEIPVDGDGTVAVMSAAMGDPWRNTLIASGAQLWYVQRDHGALVQRDYVLGVAVGDGPSLTWVGNLLRGAIAMSTTSTRSSTQAVEGATREPGEKLSGAWIAALGPVALEVRDAEGRATGRAAGNQDAPAPGIPESHYEQLPGSEFAFLKRDAGYTLDLAAEAAGSVDVKVRVLGNGRVERTALYLNVLLGEQGRARLALRPGAGAAAAPQGWPALEVDADGDGIFEAPVPASAVLDARESADAEAPALEFTGPPAAGPGNRAAVSWRASDAGAGLLLERATIDPDTAAPIEVANGDSVSLLPGEHRLLVVVVDRAGNARSHETTFTVP